MKVAYLSSAKLPSKTANSIHIMKMCNAFVQNNCEVTLFAYVSPQYNVDQILSYYDIKTKFNIIPLNGQNLPFSGMRNGFQMAYKALRIKPDLILGRDLKACYFSVLFGVKTYFEIHAPIEESGKVNRFLFKRMLKKKNFQKLVLITKSLNQFYTSRYSEIIGRTLVLPDGADKVDVGHISNIGIRKQGKVNIGYTGHLYAGKGMEIIADLVPRCPFAHFHIVGGREEDLAHWSYLKQHDNITFYGYVNHSEIKNYIAEFDIVLLPNQRYVKGNAGRDIGRWTSPLKLFEYMAMGKPIVCSNLEVLKEIAKQDRNALLCDPDNIDAWVDSIKLLSSNAQLAKKLGETARHEFEFNYTWERRVRKLLNDFKNQDE